jgi:hypothetical protein
VTPADFDKLVATLPQLTMIQIKELRARLQALEAPKDEPVVGDWLTNGILLELKRRGLTHGTGTVWKRILPKGYAEECAEVRGLLLQRVHRALSPAEQHVMGQIVARALADYLIVRAPLGLRGMLTNIWNVPTAMEASYPGYLGSGFMELLLKGSACG